MTDFMLNSDRPLDKVIYVYKGSLTVPSGGSRNAEISHGLPFTPLAFGNWSTDSGFSITYEYGSGPIHNNLSQAIFSTQVSATSHQSVILVSAQNFFSSSRTVYYRLYGFQPTGSGSPELPYTNTGVDDFMINTDNEQAQLINAGSDTFPSVSWPDTYEKTLYTHNLGYRPQTMAWVERDGRIEHLYMSDMGDDSTAVYATTSAIILRSEGEALSGRIHWRVYANE